LEKGTVSGTLWVNGSTQEVPSEVKYRLIGNALIGCRWCTKRTV